MVDIPLWAMIALLIVLLLLSAYFSSSETAILSCNRHLLNSLKKEKNNRSAARVLRLLKNLDPVISTILLGNNFVNITASAITTLLALQLFGSQAVAIATGILTVVILIFCEIIPKALATRKAETIAMYNSFFLEPLVKVLGVPLAWILRLFGLNEAQGQKVSLDEIKSIVTHGETEIARKHLDILSRVVSMGERQVEDVMTPRVAIEGLNIQDSPKDLVKRVSESSHQELVVFNGSLDSILGIVPSKTLRMGATLDKDNIVSRIKSHLIHPTFVPKYKPLIDQIENLRTHRLHSALVVDEYGDIVGLVTDRGLLKELLGFEGEQKIQKQAQGLYLADASCLVHDLNRITRLQLKSSKASTLNGLLLETLGSVPSHDLSLKIGEVVFTIRTRNSVTESNGIQSVEIYTRKINHFSQD